MELSNALTSSLAMIHQHFLQRDDDVQKVFHWSMTKADQRSDEVFRVLNERLVASETANSQNLELVRKKILEHDTRLHHVDANIAISTMKANSHEAGINELAQRVLRLETEAGRIAQNVVDLEQFAEQEQAQSQAVLHQQPQAVLHQQSASSGLDRGIPVSQELVGPRATPKSPR